MIGLFFHHFSLRISLNSSKFIAKLKIASHYFLVFGKQNGWNNIDCEKNPLNVVIVTIHLGMLQDVPAMPQKSKIIVNKRKIDELKDQALLPDIDYADLVNQTRARTSGIKRKLPVKARLGINPTSQHPTAGKVKRIQ